MQNPAFKAAREKENRAAHRTRKHHSTQRAGSQSISEKSEPGIAKTRETTKQKPGEPRPDRNFAGGTKKDGTHAQAKRQNPSRYPCPLRWRGRTRGGSHLSQCITQNRGRMYKVPLFYLEQKTSERKAVKGSFAAREEIPANCRHRVGGLFPPGDTGFLYYMTREKTRCENLFLPQNS